MCQGSLSVFTNDQGGIVDDRAHKAPLVSSCRSAHTECIRVPAPPLILVDETHKLLQTMMRVRAGGRR